jgi:uncharacterized oligopeptide transporter (OPT) family protein
MATIVKGLLGGNLQWAYVLIGAAMAVMVQVTGVSALAWAVGAYLPLSTTMPIFIGGMMRLVAERRSGQREESEISSGMLYSTGLVAGGSIAGVLIAALSAVYVGERNLLDIAQIGRGIGFLHEGASSHLIALVVFAGLCYLQYRAARRTIKGLD